MGEWPKRIPCRWCGTPSRNLNLPFGYVPCSTCAWSGLTRSSGAISSPPGYKHDKDSCSHCGGSGRTVCPGCTGDGHIWLYSDGTDSRYRNPDPLDK